MHTWNPFVGDRDKKKWHCAVGEGRYRGIVTVREQVTRRRSAASGVMARR